MPRLLLSEIAKAWLRKSDNWTEAPNGTWVDERRKRIDAAGVPSVPIETAFARELAYEQEP